MKKLGVILVILLSISLSYSSLYVTNNHPFLVNSSWIEASELRVGDYLTSIDGKKVRITSIQDIKGTKEVFNFETLFHNYIVNNIIVHNSDLEYFKSKPDLFYDTLNILPTKNNLRQLEFTYSENIAKNLNGNNLNELFYQELGAKNGPGFRGAKGIYYNDGKSELGLLWSGEGVLAHHMDMAIYILQKLGKLPQTKEEMFARYNLKEDSREDIWYKVYKEFGSNFVGFEYQVFNGFIGMPDNMKYKFRISSYMDSTRIIEKTEVSKELLQNAIKWAGSRRNENGCNVFSWGQSWPEIERSFNIVP